MLSRAREGLAQKFASSFVAVSAESAFKAEVRKFCVGFTPTHVQRAAESKIPLEELIARAGFTLKPTPERALNMWQRYLVALPEEHLLELVRESVSPAHVAMLERYPQVAQALINVVKGMVVPG